jgi:hypothetical protein
MYGKFVKNGRMAHVGLDNLDLERVLRAEVPPV